MIVQQQVQVPSKRKCKMETVKLNVLVEPGSSDGDSVVFKSLGEQQPKKIPGDIVLKMKARKHDVFRRMGMDLHMDIDISLREALLGFDRTIKHLDGHSVSISFRGVMQPFGVLRIDEEGMPQKGDPTTRGALFVKCRIKMPEGGAAWLQENHLGA